MIYFSFLGWGIRVIYNSDIFEKFSNRNWDFFGFVSSLAPHYEGIFPFFSYFVLGLWQFDINPDFLHIKCTKIEPIFAKNSNFRLYTSKSNLIWGTAYIHIHDTPMKHLWTHQRIFVPKKIAWMMIIFMHGALLLHALTDSARKQHEE